MLNQAFQRNYFLPSSTELLNRRRPPCQKVSQKPLAKAAAFDSPSCILSSSTCVPGYSKATQIKFTQASRKQAPYHRGSTRSIVVPKAAASTAVEESDSPAPGSAGIEPIPALVAISVGLIIKFIVPCPAELTMQAWNLLAIFVSTVVGLVLKPVPVGAWAFMMLTFTLLTKTLPFTAALSALTNEVIWLIVVATFFARAFVKTGFGDRCALFFVKIFGKTTLSLAYGLQTAELVMCPALPSSTARAGGVFVPIINGLDKRSRSFLTAAQLQGQNSNCNILLTASAQNFLCIKLAQEFGIGFTNPFNQWLLAAIVPCLVAIYVMPYIIYMIDPPEVKDTPEAPAKAAEALTAMGPLNNNDKKMLAALIVTISLWVFGTQLGISAVLGAMIGLSMLLASGVITWDDALQEKSAWDALVWFAILISMSAQLNALGVVAWLSSSVSTALAAAKLHWLGSFGLLHLGFYMLHYVMASQTAHVASLFTAFLGMMVAAGCPPVLSALTLSFNGNLNGGMTHYASGQAAVMYNTGYVPLPKLWKIGVYCGIANALIWGTVGMGWWKVIGLW